MGGFGTAFAGALEGVGDALHREHQEQFATEVENRKSLMKMYGEMAMNPNVPPHVQREALRRWGTITQVPYNKKLPSDLTKPIDPAALLAQQPQAQGAPQGPSQPQGQPQAAAAPAGPSASIVPGAAASLGPASPISSGGGASPGVLQGQANQLPPAQVQAAAPPPAPPSGASGAGITYTPQEIASQDASRASQITSAQTEAQLISKYQSYIKMGMDPQRAAFLASGMAAMVKPSGINVITDDGKHQAATKMFDPTDMRYHYWVGDQDITDHVVGTATSNAQVQAWPRVTEKGVGGAAAAIQMVPNGPVYRRDDPANPPEVQQQFVTLSAPVTTTRSGGTTTDEFGNTRTSSTSTRSVGATPPPAPSKSGKSAARPSAAGGAPAPSGEGKLGYDTNKMLRADAIKASNTIRPMVTLLDSAEQYYKSSKFDSAGDLGLIINAVRSMNPGTVRLPNTELQLEIQRGTYGQRAQRWYQSRLADGTLPQQFRDELMGVIRRETTTAASEAAKNWTQVMGKQQLPPHLKRFGNTGVAPADATGRPPLSSFEKK